MRREFFGERLSAISAISAVEHFFTCAEAERHLEVPMIRPQLVFALALVVLTGSLAAAQPPAGGAQPPPPPMTNLQIYPKDTPRPEVVTH